MKARDLVASSVLLVCLMISPGQPLAQPPVASTSAYMWVEANGAQIVGPVTEPGREGSIRLLGFDHLIERPYDPNTGLPTGYPNHYPVWIKKEVDQTSPLLYLTLNDNQDVNLIIRFYQPGDGGEDVHVYTVETIEGRTIAIQEQMPDQTDPFNLALGFYDSCGFVYRRIIWTWEEGGIQYQADWISGNQDLANPAAYDEDLALMPPWPNPATGRANLRLALPMNTDAELQVFDLAGRRIRQLHSGKLGSWDQQFAWDGRNQRGEEVARSLSRSVVLGWRGRDEACDLDSLNPERGATIA